MKAEGEAAGAASDGGGQLLRRLLPRRPGTRVTDPPPPAAPARRLGETAPDAGTPACDVGLLRASRQVATLPRANLGVFI